MQNTEDVFAVLKNLLLSFLDIEEGDITPNSQLSALGLDSLDYVDIQVEIQKTYGVEITPDTFSSGIATLGELAAHVSQLSAQASQDAA